MVKRFWKPQSPRTFWLKIQMKNCLNFKDFVSFFLLKQALCYIKMIKVSFSKEFFFLYSPRLQLNWSSWKWNALCLDHIGMSGTTTAAATTTTTDSLHSAIGCLTALPDWQNKLQIEIDNYASQDFNEDQVKRLPGPGKEMISNLPLLRAFVDEVLRLYPPFKFSMWFLSLFWFRVLTTSFFWHLFFCDKLVERPWEM